MARLYNVAIYPTSLVSSIISKFSLYIRAMGRDNRKDNKTQLDIQFLDVLSLYSKLAI